MKVRLLESAHDTWAPAGTVGELTEVNGSYRFVPDGIAEHLPLGIWIGRVKWKEVKNIAEPVKRRRQSNPR